MASLPSLHALLCVTAHSGPVRMVVGLKTSDSIKFSTQAQQVVLLSFAVLMACNVRVLFVVGLKVGRNTLFSEPFESVFVDMIFLLLDALVCLS